MKRVIVYIILVSFVFCQCGRHFYNGYKTTGLVIVSCRIGELIEPDERAQFGLFPDLEEFQKAEFEGITGGGYELSIKTEDQYLRIRNIGSDALALLSDYIDNYEEVIETKRKFEDKWGIIAYDGLGLPITEKEVELYRTGNSWKSYGCGILTGAGIIAFSLFTAVSIALEDIFNPSSSSEREATIVLLGGTAVGIVTGILAGSRLKVRSREEAIEMIKEARKPCIVDKDD